jgi:phosphatidyl-myo-inositol alpha-mannosyltransferase
VAIRRAEQDRGAEYQTGSDHRGKLAEQCIVLGAMKIGIVVPYSWSFWGAVVEHAELQAAALRNLGHDVRLVMGNDPPGSFTRVLHPRLGRHDEPPPEVIPIGRSVIVPANGTLPNIILSPRSVFRIRRVLERERFDLIHVHEPMTPTPGVATLALADCPLVATFHASGELSWLKLAKPVWGFLLDRLDHRIAVSEPARESVARYFPGDYELIPNGVLVPERAEAGSREDRIVFVGRHEPRKGLQVLLRAWPEIRRRSGMRLRVIGADPLAVRLLFARLRVSDDGVDVLGFLSQDALTEELLRGKALVAPSLGGESFGMVLTRAFACATPVVASDISGYRGVMEPEAGRLVPPGDPNALADAVVALLDDEPTRVRLGRAARALAEERYSWDGIAQRLAEIYESLAGSRRAVAA